MSNKNRRKVTFNPRFSIYNKRKNFIQFDMTENFDFSSIKNIITIKFIVPITKAVTILLAKIKNNDIKFKQYKATTDVIMNAKTEDNTLKLIDKGAATIIISSSTEPTNFSAKVITNNLNIKFYAKSSDKINVINSCFEHLILSTVGCIKQKFTNTANAQLKLNLTSRNNEINLKNSVSTASQTLFIKSNPNDKLRVGAVGTANLKLHTATYSNSTSFKTQANAFVYRPTKLGDLYDVKIGDLYDKKLGDLYGTELF